MWRQATEQIREGNGPNRRTPIVAVTANAMKGDREKVSHGKCAGAHGYDVHRYIILFSMAKKISAAVERFCIE